MVIGFPLNYITNFVGCDSQSTVLRPVTSHRPNPRPTVARPTAGTKITEKPIKSFVFFVALCESTVQDFDDRYKITKKLTKP
jgi:hypothetical protein